MFINHQNEIKNLLTSEQFPWNHLTSTVAGPNEPGWIDYPNVYDSFQFIHLFRDSNNVTSNYYSLIHPLIILAEKELGLSLLNNVHRIKANLLLPSISSEGKYHYPHQDIAIDTFPKEKKPKARSLKIGRAHV